MAILVTPVIAEEIALVDDGPRSKVRRGRIGDDEVEVSIGSVGDGDPGPVVVLVTGWMREHLYLYSRELWHRPHRAGSRGPSPDPDRHAGRRHSPLPPMSPGPQRPPAA